MKMGWRVTMSDGRLNGTQVWARELFDDSRLVGLLKALPDTVTVVIVEHDLDVVFALATSVTVLHLGKLLLTGSPDEVRSSSAVQEAYLGTGREALFLDTPTTTAPATGDRTKELGVS